MIIFIFFVDVLLKTPKTTDMDTFFRRESSNADTNLRKMGQSQRRIKEGGFESSGLFPLILGFFLSTFKQTKPKASVGAHFG